MNYNLEYTFYYQYNSSELFNNIFNKRKQNILLNNNSQYKKCDNELKLVEEYFVEIFCWTVIPKDLLYNINEILESFINDYTLIDPCSGNSFHTFLFHEFCKKDVITIDIQKEKDAWITTIECDGLDYIKNNIIDFSDKVLLLSWIDYDELTTNLLKNFKGNIILSVGNHEEGNSKNYLITLEEKYDLVNHFILNMPWNLKEHIKIFKKKLLI